MFLHFAWLVAAGSYLLHTVDTATAPALDDFPALSSKVVMKRLPNGIRVIVLPRGEAPVVSFHTYVDVGSVDERPGITGIAHMFEHMAFKGSRRVGTKDWSAEQAALAAEEKAYLALREAQDAKRAADLPALEKAFEAARAKALALVASEEYSSAIERAGGVGLNASTGADTTQYFYSLPANKLELWAWMESERFTDPVLREFYKERDVVHEERRLRTDSSPIGRLVEEGLIAAFDGHPYGRPVIGFREDLDHFSRTDAEEFYKRTYGPSKLVLAIVGNVDPAETIAVVERYFSRIAKNDPVGAPPEPGPRAPGEKRIQVPVDAQPVYLSIYRRPSATNADDAVHRSIADLLGGGEHSRLHKAVVKTGIAVEAQAIPSFPGDKYSTGFAIFAIPAQGKTAEDVERAVDVEIARLAKEGPSPAEMEGVKLRARAQFLQQIDSNAGLARELAQNEAIGGGWSETFHQLSKIGAVTAERVKAVASQSLVPSNRTVATIAPPNAKK